MSALHAKKAESAYPSDHVPRTRADHPRAQLPGWAGEKERESALELANSPICLKPREILRGHPSIDGPIQNGARECIYY